LVHARFSTNTLGAWHLAHPYRNIVHNGEFNTIRGNVNWMRARENDLDHPAFGAELDTIKPVIDDPNQSDTASVDNAVELLLQAGRDLPHTLRMLIPEAFRDDDLMEQARADFYDYHASLVEPWDGPALVIGFDGDRVAGVLDRNGLRPCRYEVTEDNRLVVGSSEVGALPTEPADVRRRGRLQPGEIFVADPEQGRIVPDDEVFDDLTDEKYGEWVAERQVALDEIVEEDDVAAGVESESDDSDDTGEDGDAEPTVRAHQAAFGYTTDSLDHLVEPMARRKGPGRFDGRRHPRCRCSPMSTARCSPTSNSCSRRCRTRRSTISARSSSPRWRPGSATSATCWTRRPNTPSRSSPTPPCSPTRRRPRCARTPWPGRTRAGRQKGRRAGRVVVHLGSRRRDVRPRRVAGRRGESNP